MKKTSKKSKIRKSKRLKSKNNERNRKIKIKTLPVIKQIENEKVVKLNQ